MFKFRYIVLVLALVWAVVFSVNMLTLSVWAGYLEYQSQGDCIGKLIALGIERSDIEVFEGGGCSIKLTR